MKFIVITISYLVLAFVGFYFWAKNSQLSVGWSLGKIKTQEEKNFPPEKPDELTVMSWNMAFAHGLGSEGVGYEKQSKEHYQKNLDEMAHYISENNVDILLLQEIDFDSARTYQIDEAHYLAEKTDLSYIAYASSWDNRYIPFPYWPISKHFGKMNSGGAILSRYPIVDNQVYLFEKPKSNPIWYNAFYLYRYFQAAKIQIDQKSFYVGNLHVEAFDKLTRMEQAKTIIKLKEELTSAPWLVVGGDFNSTPSYASKRSEFDGYPEDDYEEDETLDIFAEGFSELQEILTEDEYKASEKKWFTFSTDNPTRRLDYFFVNKEAGVKEKFVGSSKVSDHFPLIMKIDINSLLQ